MSSRVFLSPETELFFVKMHIIHALAETTAEAYWLMVKQHTTVIMGFKKWPEFMQTQF